ncbi:hypothetical protein SBOR_9669 [Sclerotinia borealis F-4128]|uniref:Uncharacterized protein n=1 Tax=Sclerotinia borealis (strain F-4128) TaxID=1432307 RepID=W9BZE8_SCLBF|nr:hypothetical protein SBOR_9669 [Sclerotinia borealis F-4128]
MPSLSFKRTPLEDWQKIQIAGLEGTVKALRNEVAAEKMNVASHVKSEKEIDSNWRRHVDGLFRGLRKDCAALQRSIEDKIIESCRYNGSGYQFSEGREADYRNAIRSPGCDGVGCQTSGSNRNGKRDQGFQGGQGGKRMQGTQERGWGGQELQENEEDNEDKGSQGDQVEDVSQGSWGDQGGQGSWGDQGDQGEQAEQVDQEAEGEQGGWN